MLVFGSADNKTITRRSGLELAIPDLPIANKIRRIVHGSGVLTEVERMRPKDIGYEEPTGCVIKYGDVDQGLCLENYPWEGRW